MTNARRRRLIDDVSKQLGRTDYDDFPGKQRPYPYLVPNNYSHFTKPKEAKQTYRKFGLDDVLVAREEAQERRKRSLAASDVRSARFQERENQTNSNKLRKDVRHVELMPNKEPALDLDKAIKKLKKAWGI